VGRTRPAWRRGRAHQRRPGGPLAAPGLRRLAERAPEVRLITISGAGTDVAAQPAALAAALEQLINLEEQP
jgi:hypothetical protein